MPFGANLAEIQAVERRAILASVIGINMTVHAVTAMAFILEQQAILDSFASHNAIANNADATGAEEAETTKKRPVSPVTCRDAASLFAGPHDRSDPDCALPIPVC
jgi:hypothetical protein